MAASLLLAHAGWNRTLGRELKGYAKALRAFEKARPDFWDELRSRDPEVLIAEVADVKMLSHANDRRVVVSCGTPEGKVRVEWCEENDFEAASKEVRRKIALQLKTGLIRRVKDNP